MSSNSPAVRKLKREYGRLEAEPVHEGISVRPLESNFLHAHFLLSGEVFHDTPYEGGVYHGVLQFPKEYPFKPPSIIMRTPSGRFNPNNKICFSMSDFHPESWEPSWSIRTILSGFVSFMNGNEITTGGVDAPAAVRVKYAKQSLSHCMDPAKDELAMKIFDDVLEDIQAERKNLGSSWPPARATTSTASSNKTASASKASVPPKAASPKPPVQKEGGGGDGGGGKNSSKNKKKKERERRKKLVAKFSKELEEQVPSFVTSVSQELQSRFGLDVSSLMADHVCYRTDSLEQYTALVEALRSASDAYSQLIESEIGGRLIATFKLAKPIISEDGCHLINVIEITSPKEGRPYPAGFEHVEFVIGDGSHLSPMNSDAHQSAFDAWMEQYPAVKWDTKAKDKECNPDISTDKIELDNYGTISVKFHLMSLEKVIMFELEKDKSE